MLSLLLTITEQQVREDTLRCERRFLETALNSLDHLLYVFEDDLNYVRWNDRFETVTGYSSSEIRELIPMDLFDDDTKAEIEGEIERILGAGERVVLEADLVTSDNEVLPYEFTGVPAEDNGEIIGIVGIGRRLDE